MFKLGPSFIWKRVYSVSQYPSAGSCYMSRQFTIDCGRFRDPIHSDGAMNLITTRIHDIFFTQSQIQIVNRAPIIIIAGFTKRFLPICNTPIFSFIFLVHQFHIAVYFQIA